MTPPPPPSEDSSLSPRHRPSLENLNKNSTEQDLWDLDERPTEKTVEEEPQPAPRRKGIPGTSPPPPPVDASSHIASDDNTASPVLQVVVTPRHKISQSANVERLGRIRIPQAQTAENSYSPPAPARGSDSLEDTFDNLDHWDLSDARPHQDPTEEPSLALIDENSALEPELKLSAPPATEDITPAAVASADPNRDEFSPAPKPDAKPISLRPTLGLTKIESIGLIGLAVILLAGGVWVYRNSLSRLDSQVSEGHSIRFPVQGNQLAVDKVATYWRAPIKKSGQVEAVRRGVVLIPVTELTLHGGPGAIRALVHNENGSPVGDPITRLIDGDTTLIIAATDGFEDISMHAAYRTGQTKPWTVRISEAPSANSRGQDFKKLLEVPISAERR
jgi:hypothetical protein